MFLPKDLNLDYELTPADKDCDIYKEFININSDENIKDYVINERKRNVLANELSIFFKMLLTSFNSFKEYLTNKNEYIIDHTLLMDIMLKNDSITDAFLPNTNIVIFEINSSGKLDALIPSNSGYKYDEKYDTAFILKRNNLYENITLCDYKNTKRFIINKTDIDYNGTIKNIRDKTDEIINQIIKLKDDIVETKKDSNGVFRPLKILNMKPILEKNNYKIDHQIVNNQFVTTGVIVKLINGTEDNEYFIPSALEPPVDLDGKIIIDNDNGIKKYLHGVDETKKFYSNLNKMKLDIKLDKVLYYNNNNTKEIYGFLTNTLQFVPTKKELLTDQWQEEHAINIAHYYSADRIATLIDKNVIYKKVQDSRLETMYYNVFRAIMRYIISNEGLTEKRADVKVLKDKIYNKEKNLNKRAEIEIMLKKLMSSKITFIANDKYKRPSKYTDITTCITQNKDKSVCDSTSNGLIIPKNNLNEPGLDNEKFYYTRLADELVRYSHVRQFILEPNRHLNIIDDITHINDDEIITTETTLRNEIQFSEKKVGKHYPISVPYKLAHSHKK
jgi:hypothetical protein